MRVLVAASNHRERLRLDDLVRQSGVAEVVSSTDSPEDWSALVQSRAPDLLVTDSPDALPAGAHALVLSPDSVPLEGPVRASLPPDASAEELAAALRAVEAGLLVLHPSLRLPGPSHDGHPATPLTARETEVLAMLAEGLGNKIIAGRLGISDNTVKFHVSSILEKLEAGSRTEAVTRGLRQGLVII